MRLSEWSQFLFVCSICEGVRRKSVCFVCGICGGVRVPNLYFVCGISCVGE